MNVTTSAEDIEPTMVLTPDDAMKLTTALPCELRELILSFVSVEIGLSRSSDEKYDIMCRVCMDKGLDCCHLPHVDAIYVAIYDAPRMFNEFINGSHPVGFLISKYMQIVDDIECEIEECDDAISKLLDDGVNLIGKLYNAYVVIPCETNHIRKLLVKERLNNIKDEEHMSYIKLLIKYSEKKDLKSELKHIEHECDRIRRRENFFIELGWENKWCSLKYELYSHFNRICL